MSVDRVRVVIELIDLSKTFTDTNAKECRLISSSYVSMSSYHKIVIFIKSKQEIHGKHPYYTFKIYSDIDELLHTYNVSLSDYNIIMKLDIYTVTFSRPTLISYRMVNDKKEYYLPDLKTIKETGLMVYKTFNVDKSMYDKIINYIMTCSPTCEDHRTKYGCVNCQILNSYLLVINGIDVDYKRYISYPVMEDILNIINKKKNNNDNDDDAACKWNKCTVS